MRTWIAIAGSPSVALTALGIAYARAQPACAAGSQAWLHGTFAVGLALCLLLAALGAWPPAGQGAAADARDVFLRRLALGSGLFFALTVAMQWLAVFLLSPCVA